MHFALEAEKIHEKMFQNAGEQAAAGKDIEIAEVYICPVCGFTHIGEPPEYCPVCGAPSSKFRKF
jgi:rubrerythrin